MLPPLKCFSLKSFNMSTGSCKNTPGHGGNCLCSGK